MRQEQKQQALARTKKQQQQLTPIKAESEVVKESKILNNTVERQLSYEIAGNIYYLIYILFMYKIIYIVYYYFYIYIPFINLLYIDILPKRCYAFIIKKSF